MSEIASTETAKPSPRWQPRLLLAIWLLFLLVSILAGSPPAGEWRFSPVSGELVAYERVLDFPAHNFPGYPFVALDAVRSLLNPLFHMTRWAFLGATVLFLFLLVGATYFSASQLGDETDGLFAALLVATIPFVMSTSRVYDVHIPRLAAIALTLAALQRLTVKPKIASAVMLAGVFLLGVILCSSSTDYLFYGLALAGSLAFVFISGLLRKGNRRLFLVTGLVLLVLIVVLSPLWLRSAPFPGWIPGGERVFNDLRFFFTDSRSVFRQPAALLAYPYVLAKAMLAFPLNLVFLAGLIVFCRRIDRQKWLWLSGVIACFIGIVLLPKRNAYYAANLLPALTVAAAIGISAVLRKWRRWALPVVCALLLLLHLAYATLLLAPGRIGERWSQFFVPGIRQYALNLQSVGLEGFGTRAINEDMLAQSLIFAMADKQLPLAVGFFGQPCQQESTTVKLVYLGIYSRDLLCSPSVASSTAKFDAVVLMPRIAALPGVAEAQSAREALALVQEAIDKNAYSAGALLPSGKAISEKEVERMRELLAESMQRLGPLLSQYRQREQRDGFLLFFSESSRP